MPRILDSTELILTQTFTDSDGNPADPAEVKFDYTVGGREGPRRVGTPVSQGSGVFTVTIVPELSGYLYGRWKGAGNVPEQAHPVVVPIFSSAGVRS